MSLRARAAALLLRHHFRPRLARESLEQRRRTFALTAVFLGPPRGTRVEEIEFGGVRCERATPPGGGGHGPTVFYLFGGGYTMGSPAIDRGLATRVAAAAGGVAVSPEYRLRPEHRLEHSLADALAAYRGLLAAGADPARVVVAGESAGGGLALRLLCALRDGAEPLPACAYLMSPWTDLSGGGDSNRDNVHLDTVFDPRWAQENIALVLDGVDDPRDPSLSPLFADHRGLPPMLVQAAATEVLRDDSTRFARSALDAGVDVRLDVIEGVWHVHHFYWWLPETRDALQRFAAFAARHLGEPRPDGRG